MEKSNEKSAASRAIARVPAFAVTPPPRCFTSVGSSPARKCGELATKRRHGGRWFGDSFHCDEHAHETDLDISGDFVIRRVRVVCEILFAGVDELEGVAQREAVARLAAAIAAAGGVLDEKLTTSQIGRYPAYGAARGVPPALES